MLSVLEAELWHAVLFYCVGGVMRNVPNLSLTWTNRGDGSGRERGGCPC